MLEQADQMAAGYAQGKVGLTDAVLASQKADTTFRSRWRFATKRSPPTRKS